MDGKYPPIYCGWSTHAWGQEVQRAVQVERMGRFQILTVPGAWPRSLDFRKMLLGVTAGALIVTMEPDF